MMVYSVHVLDMVLLPSSESVHCHINSKEIQKQVHSFLRKNASKIKKEEPVTASNAKLH